MTGGVRVQKVVLPGGGRTWTVLGSDHLPVGPIEQFLEYCRQRGYSPNTAKSYARALTLWWEYLAQAGLDWRTVGISELGGYPTWLRSGVPDGVAALRPGEQRFKESTVAQRFAALSAFYAFHDLVGDELASRLYQRVFAAPRGYVPLLEHVERRKGRARNVLAPRREGPRRPPILAPDQIEAIKAACATREAGAWVGSVRDRLFWGLLEDSGLRRGEALGLQHRDWHTGRGDTPYVEVVPREDSPDARVKGGRWRRVFISDATDRLYGEWLWMLCDLGADQAVEDFDASYVFVNYVREPLFSPMQPGAVDKLVARLRRKLRGVVPADWSAHWFRHTHATALLLAGRPLHVVSRRLGHGDVQTTLNYYGWVTEDAELRALADWKRFAAGWRVEA